KGLPEIGREYPDHAVGFAIQDERFADDVGVRGKAALPISIAQHRDRITCLPRALSGREAATEHRVATHHCEEIRGDPQARYLLRLAAAGHRARANFQQRHFLEGLASFLPIQETRSGTTFALDAVFEVGFPDDS